MLCIAFMLMYSYTFLSIILKKLLLEGTYKHWKEKEREKQGKRENIQWWGMVVLQSLSFISPSYQDFGHVHTHTFTFQAVGLGFELPCGISFPVYSS